MLVGIFGTGRNGSTLMCHILDGIPNAYVHPIEINFLSVWSDLATRGKVTKKTIQNSSRAPLLGLDRRLPTTLLLGYYGDHVQQIRENYIGQIEEKLSLGPNPLEMLRKKSDYSVIEFTETFLRAFSNWVNNNRLIENLIFKTIDVAYVADHEKVYQGLKFIHLIRDPMAMYSSQKRSLMCHKSLPSWYLGRDNLETMIDMRWIPHAKAILKYKSTPNHYVIRYEDITKDPLKEVKAICDWLHTPMPPDPTKQTTLGGYFMKKIHVKPSQKGIETPVEVQANMQQTLGYEEVLTDRERQLIIYRTMEPAQKLGYFPDAHKASALQITKSWFLPDRWEFRNSHNIQGSLQSLFSAFSRRIYIYGSVLMGKIST